MSTRHFGIPANAYSAVGHHHAASDITSGTMATSRLPDSAATVLDVKDYGAAGNGTTDDTAAIQAAIDAAPTDSGSFAIQADQRGAVVYIPAGRYRVTGQITLKPGVTMRGTGPQSSLLVNEGSTNHVLYYLGAVGGVIAPIVLEDFAVVQKSGVSHSTGSAIYINGNGYGCTVAISRVSTHSTAYGLRLRDTYLSSINRVEAYSHINGFYLDSLCTSLNFEACYAGSCSQSGYKIFGSYLTFTGCGSDSNTLDGYEVYYNSGAATSVAFIGCGSEQFGRNGISCDRASGVTIISPRLIAAASAGSAISVTGGAQYAVISPALSCISANANPALDINNSSGAYPTAVAIVALGQATNYATLVSNDDRAFYFSDYTAMGLNAKGLRLGPITSFDQNLQSFFLGATPTGSSGTAYGASVRPIANAAHTTFAGAHFRPEVNATGLTIARVMGQYVVSPTVTAGTVTRAEGVRIEEITAGGTGNANLALGASAIAAGNWNIHSSSTRDSYFAGPLRLASTTGPTVSGGTGTPEGSVTAPVGSVYFRTDGGAGTVLYAKESGSGNTGWVPVGLVSTVDAKGDLLVGTADNTVARVAVGTNGYSLVADSTQSAGVKWAQRTADIQTFTSTGTWTKPTGAVAVNIVLYGGGGGGGSGRRGAAGSARGGGGGGGAAAYVNVTLPASALPSSATVTVGAGGTGGTAISANDTNGNAGAVGGQTSFGTLLRAENGLAGAGGTTAGGAGGGATSGMTSSGAGAAGGGSTPAGSSTVNTIAGFPNGGGGGGGISAADAAGNGGTYNYYVITANYSGGAGGVVDSTAPTSGTAAASAGVPLPGGGGGGGAASITTAAQAGANGNVYGGGGGGGGASLNNTGNSGAGGNGGAGMAQITTYF